MSIQGHSDIATQIIPGSFNPFEFFEVIIEDVVSEYCLASCLTHIENNEYLGADEMRMKSIVINFVLWSHTVSF
jgi:hypothetical protein